MARVTVEDCVDKVNNRFELVLLAATRARRAVAFFQQRSISQAQLLPRTARLYRSVLYYRQYHYDY